MKLYRHLDEHIETYLASVLIVFFSLLVIFQVVMRYVFNSPLTWSEELSRFAFVWFVYVSASYAVRYQRHVKFNIFVDLTRKFSPFASLIIKFIALLFWIGFLIYLDYYSIQLVIDQFNTQQLSPANQIPMYLIYLGLPLGSFLMTFRVIQHIAGLIKEMKATLTKGVE